MKHNDKNPVALSGRLWITKNGRHFLGGGRAELLEHIDRLGSLSMAARAMKMSYKAAWDAVAALNKAAGEPIVESTTGGTHGGRSGLTDKGRKFLKAFRSLENKHREFLKKLQESL